MIASAKRPLPLPSCCDHTVRPFIGWDPGVWMTTLETRASQPWVSCLLGALFSDVRGARQSKPFRLWVRVLCLWSAALFSGVTGGSRQPGCSALLRRSGDAGHWVFAVPVPSPDFGPRNRATTKYTDSTGHFAFRLFSGANSRPESGPPCVAACLMTPASDESKVSFLARGGRVWKNIGLLALFLGNPVRQASFHMAGCSAGMKSKCEYWDHRTLELPV